MFRTIFDEEKKLWHGPKFKMKWTDEPSLGAKILKALKFNGSNIAQICAVTGETRTHEELHRLTVRTAINLKKFGCKRGRKIFLITDNIANLPPFVFAAFCLGCPLVSLVFNASQEECEYFMSITRPEFAICEPKHHSMLKKCFKNLQIEAKIFTIDGQVDDSISTEHFFEMVDGEEDFEPVQLDIRKDTAYILQTSGTTGLNKGIDDDDEILNEPTLSDRHMVDD